MRLKHAVRAAVPALALDVMDQVLDNWRRES